MNGFASTPCSRSNTPLSTRSRKNSRSSWQWASASVMTRFRNASARSMLSDRSKNAISGSTIQNSARWRGVFEFSARNVGPNVYTFPSPHANVSACSCPLTVRNAGFPKKSFE